MSRTVTLNVFDAALPALSFAETETAVVPIGNVEPETGLEIGVIGPSTLSVAVGANTTVAPAALVASTTMFAGTVIDGGVASLIVRSKEVDAVNPLAPVPVIVTVDVPSSVGEAV